MVMVMGLVEAPFFSLPLCSQYLFGAGERREFILLNGNEDLLAARQNKTAFLHCVALHDGSVDLSGVFCYSALWIRPADSSVSCFYRHFTVEPLISPFLSLSPSTSSSYDFCHAQPVFAFCESRVSPEQKRG